MSNRVRVIDNISGTVLFETSIEKISEAYSFAAILEDEGLDIKIDSPGLAETLIKSLGADEAEIAEYKQSMDNELVDHEVDYGCTFCPPPKK
ncbi:MAG: hypothetical protein H7281_03805 [Bacteriovorax sp.]|nr:hypothetical protein [Bacteriovorax sp.]